MITDLSNFIPSYPARDDPDFMKKMAIKEEFRELLIDPAGENRDMPFFYNAQMLIGRWMAPWTLNRSLLVFHDPGTGKTRSSLSYMTTWMQYSNHRKSLIISGSETILKAFADEIIVYKKKDKEMNERKWISGKHSSGRAKSVTRFIKSKGFEKSTIALVNRIAREHGYATYMADIYANYNELVHMTQEDADESDLSDLYSVYQALRTEIRSRFQDHAITIDEVHIFRQGPSDNKQSYAALIFLLDALRDICPIVILTATPIVDTWKDLMSIIGLLYDAVNRDNIEDDIALVDKGDMGVDEIVKKWAHGIVSRRSSKDIVPSKLPLPGHRSSYTIVTEDEVEVPLSENIYPVFMSHYQTTVTASFEIKGERPASLDTKNIDTVSSESGVYSWRKYYDFVPPSIQLENGVTEFMSMEDLITRDQGKYIATRASYLNAGQDPVFEVIWNEDGSFSRERGLGRYSAKLAELIRLLKYNPHLQDKAGYVHTIWVEYGTKPIAAALNANGWEQYTGVGEVSASAKPRFAVIHGEKISATKIDNIIATFNADGNHDGSMLRLIVGSRKSGISISFDNAQFFFELSSTFNKSVHIQSEGRVYRASSLRWIPRNQRVIYSLSMIALPSLEEDIDDDGTTQYREDIKDGIVRDMNYYAIEDSGDILPISPYTIEMRLNYLAQDKYDISQVALVALKDVSIEEAYLKYRHLPSDRVSYNLIYAGPEIELLKEKVKDAISTSWTVKFDPTDMAQSKAVASLISDKSLVLSGYGIPAPIQDTGDFISSYRGNRSYNPLSLIYNQNFFVTEDMRSYNSRIVSLSINTLLESPTEEYEFFHRISSSTPTSAKTFILEMTISRDSLIVSEEQSRILDSRRKLILLLYASAWDTFEPSTIVHILWYMIRNGSYVSKLGITSDPRGRSRILPFNPVDRISPSRWRYETNPDIESVYLSMLARKIYETELKVVEKSKPYGFYVHFSLSDGVIRIRQINLNDLRKSRFFLIEAPEVQTFISKLLGGISLDTDTLARYIYYAAKEKGILMIR